MTLKVETAAKYDGSFPYFCEPREIGHFSLDCDRNYCDDNHQLKYIIMPRRLTGLHMDLNDGYLDAVRKDNSKKEKINILLKWILSHQEDVKQNFANSSVPSK